MTPFLSQFEPYDFPLMGLVRLPSIVISDADKAELGLKPNASNLIFLKTLAWKRYLSLRAAGKFDDIKETDVIERLKFECGVLDKTGTVDYILMVWDICRWCDKQGIPRGPGRGSVCGSLVCYLAGVTKVNSLRYSLNFTRFLSEARVKPQIIDGIAYADGRSMCDIDSDFSIARRKEIQGYIDSKYPNRVAKISNVTCLTGKTALKDVLKVYFEWGDSEAMIVTNRLEAHFGKADKLQDAAEKNKEYKEWLTEDSRNMEAHKLALSLQGLATHKGVHASGLFMSYDILDNTLPVELTTDKDKEDYITTSYDMDRVAEIGVKLDNLGLKTLDVIQEAARLAQLDPDEIDIEHPSIYEFIAKSRLYYGLFQIETGLAGDTAHKAKPRDLMQLSAVLAIARPGALKEIPKLVRYFETGEIESIYSPIDALLKSTGNIIIYQESINDICQKVYGMTAVDADEVRRAIGKKKREDIKKWEPILFAQGDKLGVPKGVTQHFWDTCNASADYLFNLGHSAAYSIICAQTTYLKANHPKEFYLATLKFAKKEEMPAIISEAQQLGVKVLPPSIIHSEVDFIFEGDAIRFGLGHIKGIAAANLAKVSSFRRDFKSKWEVFEFASTLGVSINILETLFWSGALSIDNTPRLKLAMEARGYNEMSKTLQRSVVAFAADYDNDLMETIRALKEKTNEKGKPLLPPTQLDTFRRNFSPYWTLYQRNVKYEELFVYMAERALLGFSFSNTLHNLYSAKVPDLVPVDIAAKEPKDVQVSFVAFVDEVKKSVGKESKKPYARFYLSDESGSIKALISGQNKMDACEQFNGPVGEGDVVVIHGSSSGDGLAFVNSLVKQVMPIRLKKGQLEMVST
jgi:DNA-directed DNA polymerase III PolC